MRVNISYSLEFGDIPSEVAKFVQELENGQEEISKIYFQISSELNDEKITTARQSIDNVRKKLINVDARLQDCTNILIGYQKALFGVPEQEVQAPQGDGNNVDEG